MDASDDATLLLRLSRNVTASLDLQEVLDESLRAMRSLVSFGGGAIQLIEDDMLVAAATDPPASPEAMQVRIPVGQGISGTIAANGEPIYIPDIQQDPRVHPQARTKGVSGGVRSYFGVPLIIQGHPVGVLQVDSPKVGAFPADVRARILAFVPTIAAAVQNALLFERERRTLEQIQEAERLQRDFLALISHELRTPLTTVAGFAQTLIRHADTLEPSMISDFGHRIWRASRRLSRVMGDLLDLSELEQDRLTVNIQPVDVAAIAQAAVAEQHDAAHPVTLSVEQDVPKAAADPARVRQIIGNLISNGRKFSPAGSPIEINVRGEDPAVVLAVSDHGRGIAPQARELIFGRFYQSERAATRSVEGLGVGLFLVAQLCDRMNATVDVQSEQGAGSTFIVRFPAVVPARNP